MMRSKRAASKVGALERQEPFATTRELQFQKTNVQARQRERAWSQEIVFLPPPVAGTLRAPDCTDWSSAWSAL